jgi:hypothetical protein
MNGVSLDGPAPASGFDPVEEEERKRQRIYELQVRLKSPTNYPNRAADAQELKKLEAEQGARRDLAAGRADVVVDPSAGNAAKLTLYQNGFAKPPTFDTPDMTTPAANMSSSQRQRQITLLRSLVGNNPNLADPSHVERLKDLEHAQAAAAAAPKAPPAAPPSGPKMVPVDDLHSVAEVDAAIARERGFLGSPLAKLVSPTERQAHERYVRALEMVRANPTTIHDGRSLLQKLKDDEQEKIARLRSELVQLGDTQGCTDHDTVDSLTARRDHLLLARQAAADDAEAKRKYIGLDGHVGTADELARYELEQRMIAANPGSGTGALLAGLASMRGGSVDDIRAAGEAGNLVEGIGGGVGHALNTNRAGRTDTARRGSSAAGRLNSRVRARAPELPRNAPTDGLATHPNAGVPPPTATPAAPPPKAGASPGTSGSSRPNAGPYDPRAVRSDLESRYLGKVDSSTVPPENGKNVALAGRVHPVTGVPFDYRGFPIFDKHVRFDTRVPPQVSGVRNRDVHMRAATKQLRDSISRGEVSAAGFTPRQLEAIQRGDAQIPGFRWHHHQDTGRLQLVPAEVHDRTGHVGGFDLWYK